MTLQRKTIDYYEQFGFNIIPLKNKIPLINWSKYHNELIDLEEVNNFPWNETDGIGAISGIENLRCLDFDKVEDNQIVKDFMKALELGDRYDWLVRSGSRKGFHLWFYCDDDEDYLEGLGGEKSYYVFRPKKNICEQIELRWKNCQTVLPPSEHQSGNKYEFVFGEKSGIPEVAPKKIWIGKLLSAIKKLTKIDKYPDEKKIVRTEIKLNEYELTLIDEIGEYLKGKINNYDEWLRLGFALASIGELGRATFKKISINDKYNDTEKDIDNKFDELIKNHNGKINIGTLFSIAKKYEWVKPLKVFWNIRDGRVSINTNELIMILENEGFAKVFIQNEVLFIRVVNNLVEEVNIVRIKDFILKYIEDNLKTIWEKRAVREAIFRSVKKIFCESTMECLRTIKLNFVRDSKTSSYFFFDNCFIEVSKAGLKIESYDDLPGVIWKKNIINRSFVKKEDTLKCNFELLVENICRKDSERIKAFRSAIGYLLHRYKNPAMSKAIIFIDEKISDNASGRSGKGLVASAIRQMRNTVNLDGKNFSFDKTFAFQSITPETEIVFFDDVKKTFSFDRLYSIITEGITVEKKNKNEMRIEFDDTPKLLISTNYAIKGLDDSSKDRQFTIEFSDYYNANYKPTDDFFELFFIDWGKEEFNKFDNYMIDCIKYFLSDGLMTYKSKTLNRKKLIAETCQEFEEFISEIKLDTEYNKKELHKKFITEYEDFGQLRQNTLSKWTKTYANLYNLYISERKSGDERFISFNEQCNLF